jgi:hypothetical protein
MCAQMSSQIRCFGHHHHKQTLRNAAVPESLLSRWWPAQTQQNISQMLNSALHIGKLSKTSFKCSDVSHKLELCLPSSGSSLYTNQRRSTTFGLDLLIPRLVRPDDNHGPYKPIHKLDLSRML